VGPSSISGGPLRPASSLARFDEENREWIDGFRPVGPDLPARRHRVCGEKQDCVFFRWAYLEQCIQISDVSDSGVYLLCPDVRTKDGEWEAWFFANWNPGADRYRSFRELVEVLIGHLRDDKSKPSEP
jgi:hypothetical protein